MQGRSRFSDWPFMAHAISTFLFVLFKLYYLLVDSVVSGSSDVCDLALTIWRDHDAMLESSVLLDEPKDISS